MRDLETGVEELKGYDDAFFGLCLLKGRPHFERMPRGAFPHWGPWCSWWCRCARGGVAVLCHHDGRHLLDVLGAPPELLDHRQDFRPLACVPATLLDSAITCAGQREGVGEKGGVHIRVQWYLVLMFILSIILHDSICSFFVLHQHCH